MIEVVRSHDSVLPHSSLLQVNDRVVKVLDEIQYHIEAVASVFRLLVLAPVYRGRCSPPQSLSNDRQHILLYPANRDSEVIWL